MGGGGGMGAGQGGGGMVVIGSGGSQGTARAGGQSSGGRGGSGGGRVLPKDIVDRMVFDAQATAFFNYLMEKAGIDKIKDLVQQNLKKTETLQVVMSIFGSDADKTEQDFMAWVQTQK
jgi:hypothetical protein